MAKHKNSKPSTLPTTPGQDGWSTENIYSNANEYFASMLHGINNASRSVDLAVYIFRADKIGEKFVAALSRRAQQGVNVRLIVDGIGSAESISSIAHRLTAAGVEFKVFHPLPWHWTSFRWSTTPGSFSKKIFHFISTLNRRDHRKFLVVDSQFAWCGSLNICDDHLQLSPPWRDSGVRVSGDAVKELSRNFASVWHRYERKIFSRFSLRFFLTNNSPLMRHRKNKLLTDWISQSSQRVWISSAYFAPSGAVIKAIKQARDRQVDVRIVAAGTSDITLFPTLSATYYDDLIKLGVSVYTYQAGVLHAKVVLIDEQCLIGSSNLNHRSFYHDLELDIVISKPESLDEIKNELEADMRNSLIVSSGNMPRWKQSPVFGWFLRMLRYWA